MRSLLFAALLTGALGASRLALAQPAPDHLACYKVKDPSGKGRFSVTVTNAGVTQTCTVKLPARVGCIESAKSDVTPAPPGGGPAPGAAGNFLCYQLKCPKPFPPAVQMTDQFGGMRAVRFKGGQLFCAPAIRGPETIVPTTSTTTLPQGPCDFDSDSRTCQGTCPGGGRCAAVASGGACECRSTSCGDASAPECNGFCDRDEACIFTLTDCSCVTIP